MKIRTSEIKHDPELPIYVATDAHLGGKDSADNALGSAAGLRWTMSGPRLKWFWVLGGDWFEAWQYSMPEIKKAWPEESDWAIHQVITNGNHDDTDDGLMVGIDLLIIQWGTVRVGIIHDPTLEYRGIKKKAAKWAVRRIWKPIEKIIGWRKGKELSSAIDHPHSEYRDNAYKVGRGNRLDIIVYGHTHEKPFIKQMGTVMVINSGRFQDGRCEFVKLTQTEKVGRGGKEYIQTKGEIWRTDGKKARKISTE